MRKLIKGETITIYGDGRQVRDLLYVGDLIDCYLKAIIKIGETSGQVYNIGGGRRFSVSLIELLETLQRNFGENIRVKYKDWRPGDQRIYISNSAKARHEFGWKPTTSVDVGLIKLHDWLKDSLA
jgi:CDP-paratose 2-epimerase